MVVFGSGQGLRNFETAVIESYFEDSIKTSLRAQKSENAALGRKMPFVDGDQPPAGGAVSDSGQKHVENSEDTPHAGCNISLVRPGYFW